MYPLAGTLSNSVASWVTDITEDLVRACTEHFRVTFDLDIGESAHVVETVEAEHIVPMLRLVG